MELWIRSQKNYEIIPSLIKVNEIKLGKYEKEIKEVLQPKYTKMFPCLFVNSYFVVGVYETEERALEVLDEIQKLLRPEVIVKTYNLEQAELLNGTKFIQPMIEDIQIQQASTYVYEMPEE